MAMIKCMECGNPISDKANSCPKCGCPVVLKSDTPSKEKKSNGKIGCLSIFVILMVLTAIAEPSNKRHREKNNKTAPKVEVDVKRQSTRKEASTPHVDTQGEKQEELARLEAKKAADALKNRLKNLRIFKDELGTKNYIKDIRLSNKHDNSLTVTVDDEFLFRSDESKKQEHLDIQKFWEELCDDSASIQIVDLDGDEVVFTNSLGSLIIVATPRLSRLEKEKAEKKLLRNKVSAKLLVLGGMSSEVQESSFMLECVANPRGKGFLVKTVFNKSPYLWCVLLPEKVFPLNGLASSWNKGEGWPGDNLTDWEVTGLPPFAKPEYFTELFSRCNTGEWRMSEADSFADSESAEIERYRASAEFKLANDSFEKAEATRRKESELQLNKFIAVLKAKKLNYLVSVEGKDYSGNPSVSTASIYVNENFIKMDRATVLKHTRGMLTIWEKIRATAKETNASKARVLIIDSTGKMVAGSTLDDNTEVWTVKK